MEGALRRGGADEGARRLGVMPGRTDRRIDVLGARVGRLEESVAHRFADHEERIAGLE